MAIRRDAGNDPCPREPGINQARVPRWERLGGPASPGTDARRVLQLARAVGLFLPPPLARSALILALAYWPRATAGDNDMSAPRAAYEEPTALTWIEMRIPPV